jgi:hypothetical protein
MVQIASPYVAVVTQTKTRTRGWCCILHTRTYMGLHEDAHLNIPGPALHADVGVSFEVKFRNECKFPVTLHPHHVFLLAIACFKRWVHW